MEAVSSNYDAVYMKMMVLVSYFVEAAVIDTLFAAQRSITCFFLMAEMILKNGDVFPNLIGTDQRFPMDELHMRKRPEPENKDANDTDDDNDEDDDADQDDDDDAGDEDFSGEEGGEDDEEGDSEEDPTANGNGGGSDDEDEEDDDGDVDEDGDKDDEDEEEEDEDEDEQPPAKKRK